MPPRLGRELAIDSLAFICSSIFVRIDLSIFIQVRLCCQVFMYVLGEKCAGRGPGSDLIRLVDFEKEMR